MSARSGRNFVVLVYFFGALGELLFGYDVGSIGVALLFIARDLRLAAFAQGLVVSAILAGATVGVGATGLLADRYGRRPLILAMAVVFALGGAAGAVAPNFAWLIAARIAMGLGVGASSVVVMVYLAEVAPTRHRGRIAALGQLMVVSGILLAYFVDYLLAPWAAWRWMIGLSAVPALLLLVGAWFLPESPRWLVQVGRPRHAREVLVRIGRGAAAEAELADLERALGADPAVRWSLAEKWRRLAAPGLRRVLAVCAVLAMLPQLLGVNTVVYYAPAILIRAGFGERGAIAANLGIGTVNVLMTAWALGAIDRLGRRRLLLAGSVGMTVAMLALSAAGGLARAGGALADGVTLIGLVVFLGSFAMSWGTCVRIVISELLPQRVRSTAMGLVLVLNWIANFGVGLFFPLLLANLGPGATFLLFAGLGLAGFAFVARWVPETNGRSLEEIQRLLRPGGREAAAGAGGAQ